MGRVTVSEECQPQNCAGASNLAAQYAYDLLGDATSLQEQDYSGAFNFTLSYAYNRIGELSSVASSWSDSTHPTTLLGSTSYNAAGKLTGDTLGNGIAETAQYNSRLWPSSIAAGSVYSLSLGYAGDGSVTTADDSVNGNFTFTYDNVNRMATMSSPNNPSGCTGLSWTYDSVGNRTAQSVTGGTCPAFSVSVNANNQLAVSPYQYDAAGNMTNDGANAYTYDAEGRMLTVDGEAAVYVYDAFGRRVEKTTGSTSLVYLYDLGGNEIAVVNASGASVEDDIYVGSRHLAMYANDTTSFYNADQVGTERVRTTVAGAVDETCTSLPSGDNQSCTSGEPLGRFAGYDRDNEYGLAHAPARYYSPTLGRFMTADPMNSGLRVGGPLGTPLGLFGAAHARGCGAGSASTGANIAGLSPQALNRYAYVLNNPTTLTDSSGAQIEDECWLDVYLPCATAAAEAFDNCVAGVDRWAKGCELSCPVTCLAAGPVQYEGCLELCKRTCGSLESLFEGACALAFKAQLRVCDYGQGLCEDSGGAYPLL